MILKSKEDDKYKQKPFKYSIKNVAGKQTTTNINSFIEKMNEENEDDLMFIGEHFFGLPYFDEFNSSEESKNEEDQCGKICGYTIHRVFDGTQLCVLPCTKDFEFIKDSTQSVSEGSAVTGIHDKKTDQVYHKLNITTLL